MTLVRWKAPVGFRRDEWVVYASEQTIGFSDRVWSGFSEEEAALWCAAHGLSRGPRPTCDGLIYETWRLEEDRG